MRPTPVYVVPRPTNWAGLFWGFILVVFIAFVGIFISFRQASQQSADYAPLPRPRREDYRQAIVTQNPPVNLLWTAAYMPGWAKQLPPNLRDTWADLLSRRNVTGPVDRLYTGIYCDRFSITFYIDRRAWSELTAFQAGNHLMLAATLPHTDQTVVAFIDGSGKLLCNFRMNQPYGGVAIVHP